MVMHLHLILGGRMNFLVLGHDLVLQTAFQLRDPSAWRFRQETSPPYPHSDQAGPGQYQEISGSCELLQATEKITRILVRRQGVGGWKSSRRFPPSSPAPPAGSGLPSGPHSLAVAGKCRARLPRIHSAARLDHETAYRALPGQTKAVLSDCRVREGLGGLLESSVLVLQDSSKATPLRHHHNHPQRKRSSAPSVWELASRKRRLLASSSLIGFGKV